MSNRQNPRYSARHTQIMKGSLIGIGTIYKTSKNGNYAFRMCSNNKKWLKYKGNALNVFSKKYSFSTNQKIWESAVYPYFKTLKEKYYDENHVKKLNLEELKTLNGLAYAVCFCDVGSIYKKSVHFKYLKKFAANEYNTKILSEHFNNLGFKNEIVEYLNYYKIVFDQLASVDFIKMIQKHVPKFMRHKYKTMTLRSLSPIIL